MDLRRKGAQAAAVGAALALLQVGCVPLQPERTAALPAVSPPVGSGRSAPVPLVRTPPTVGFTGSPRAQARAPVIDRGTGIFTGLPRTLGPGTAATASDGVTLNFVDAEIAEVVREVLGEVLRRPYVIDPAVQGRITLATSRPVAIETLPNILDVALQSAGFTLIETSGVTRIAPVAVAATAGGAARVYRGGARRPAGYGTQVVPLAYADAAELARVLEPFARDGASVVADRARGLLVLNGLPNQIATMLDLVDIFDVDWVSGSSFALFPVRQVQPTQLVTELDYLFGSGEAGQGRGLRFVPVDRLNAVLVISRQPEQIERVRQWIDQLDRADGGGSVQLYVYAVQNGRAEDLAKLLAQIFAPRQPGGAAGQAAGVAPGLASSRTSRPAAGTAGSSTGPASAPPAADAPPGGGGGGAGGGFDGDVAGADDGALPEPDGFTDAQTRIFPDEATNSVVVMARPQVWSMIEQSLERLDAEKLQVLIEATIAEVTLNDALRYGVEYFLRFGDLELLLTEQPALTPTQLVPGFSAVLGTSDVRIIINALSAVTDVNVISTPQLLVVDNQLATLQVGDQVPIVTQQAQSVIDPNAPLVNTIEYRDTGVILEILPRVNASGRATLEISQEVSDVVPTTTSTLDSPTIRQRRVRSTVAVASGETVAIGGLIRENNTATRSGIPLLSDIPILGALFSSTSRTTNRSEILVLLTPSVIRNVDEAREVTQDLRRRVRSLQQLEGYPR